MAFVDDLGVVRERRVGDLWGRRVGDVPGGSGSGRRREALTLSLIIPTRNEVDGVGALLERLAAAVSVPAQVIFVDDSDDATSFRVRRLVERGGFGTLRVELIHRPSAARVGGLGGAVVEGLRLARGEWVCVLDADLQHPPEKIEEMLAEGQGRNVDVVVATRFGEGADADGLSSPTRRLVSKVCVAAARGAFPRRLRDVTDPMSGFFMVRRDKIDPDALHCTGFKILLDMLARYPDLTTAEVGYSFHERYAGVSKASIREGLRFSKQLAGLRLTAPRKAPVATRPFGYSIHGVITVESERRLPELDKFRVRQVEGPPTLRVRVREFGTGPSKLIDLDHATARVRFQEHLGRHGFVTEVEVGETTEISVSPLVARSPHVLYTNVVEPILRWKLVERDYALVHAACFADGDAAFLVTARTDTGKTTTMLKVLDGADYSFLSDDLVLVDRRGRVKTYPKPLTISAHTVHALKGAELSAIERAGLPLQSRVHSRAGRRFAFLLTSKHLPVATINAVVQILIPPPKYHVDRLVPGVSLGREATVAAMFIIERSTLDETRDIDPESALEILLENCEDAYGFPPYSVLEQLLHGMSEADLRAQEQSIIRDALAHRPTTLIRSTSMGWADVIAAQVKLAHQTLTPPATTHLNLDLRELQTTAAAHSHTHGNGNGNGNGRHRRRTD